MAKRILVADDSATIQRAFVMTFGAQDVDVIGARSFDDALQHARQGRPDLVIADAVMPGKSGYDLCAAVKADPGLRGVPVLILASTQLPLDEARARAAGADGHLVKPFDSQVLLDRAVEAMAKGGAVVAAAPAAAPRVAPAPARQPETASARFESLASPMADLAPPTPASRPETLPMGARPAAAPAAASRPAAPAGLRPSLIPGARPGGFPSARPGTPSAAPAPTRPAPAAALADLYNAAMGDKTAAPSAAGAGHPAAAPAAPASAAPPAASAKAPIASRTMMGLPAINVAALKAQYESQRGQPAAPSPAPLRPAAPMAPPAAAPAPAAPQQPAPLPAAIARPVQAPPRAPTPPDPVPAAAMPTPMATAVDRVVAAAAAKGPEYEALAKLSREVIERIAWEIVPELAEAILRENVDKLRK